MFDVYAGDVELTTLTFIVSVAVLLPLQLLLCFKVKSLLLRLTPAVLLTAAAVGLVLKAALSVGWEGLPYLFLAAFAGIMALSCGVGWAVWAAVKAAGRGRSRS